MSTRTNLLPMCLAVLMICAAEAYSQDAVTPDFILAGFRDSRERLTSGAFRARGVMIDDNPIAGRLEGKIEFASAFDCAQDLFRFDAVQPVRIPTGAKDVPAAKAWVPVNRGGRFVRTSQRTISWALGEKRLVAVGPPTAKPPDFVTPFDIRVAGVCTLGELDGTGGSFKGDFQGHASFAEKMKYLTSRTKMTASRVDKSLIRLDWPEKGWAVSTVFDERLGYLPVRHELRYTVPSKDQTNPFALCTTNWTRINGVYVPEKMAVRDGLAPDRVTTYDLTFEWDHVNKTVPKEIFTVEGLSLPEGLPIVSNEMKTSVTLGKVGDKEFPPVSIDSAVFGNVSWYTRKWVIVGAIGVLAAIVLGVLWVRRRRRHLPATP